MSEYCHNKDVEFFSNSPLNLTLDLQDNELLEYERTDDMQVMINQYWTIVQQEREKEDMPSIPFSVPPNVPPMNVQTFSEESSSHNSKRIRSV
jgi:hypothetical protein